MRDIGPQASECAQGIDFLCTIPSTTAKKDRAAGGTGNRPLGHKWLLTIFCPLESSHLPATQEQRLPSRLNTSASLDSISRSFLVPHAGQSARRLPTHQFRSRSFWLRAVVGRFDRRSELPSQRTH